MRVLRYAGTAVAVVAVVVAMLMGLGGMVSYAAAAGPSVCETSGRWDAEYRRRCMTVGTGADAVREWYAVPVGRKGRESADGFDRRSVCKYAGVYGGIRPAVRELFYDVAYDRYMRHVYVLRVMGEVAARDCRAMGYRV